MKALLQQYSKRLDALARRERILILAAGAGLLLMLPYTLGVAPALERAKLLSSRIAEQHNQILVAEAQKQELERALQHDPDAALRQRIAERRGQISQIDSRLASLQRTLVPPERMAAMLEELVGQDRRVRIVGLRNLPAAPLLDKAGGERAAAGPGAAASSTPSASVPAGDAAAASTHHVFKHGVEVVVEGNYLDLLAYVARLEKQTWQVYWGRTVMSSANPKIQVALTLYTLSLDQAWLVV